ncbi:hypothetical protein BK643_18125 [Pseudomonas protegens]|nr:hypothetical protein BK643_18125 [Pseudomonas protegens]
MFEFAVSAIFVVWYLSPDYLRSMAQFDRGKWLLWGARGEYSVVARGRRAGKWKYGTLLSVRQDASVEQDAAGVFQQQVQWALAAGHSSYFECWCGLIKRELQTPVSFRRQYMLGNLAVGVQVNSRALALEVDACRELAVMTCLGDAQRDGGGDLALENY